LVRLKSATRPDLLFGLQRHRGCCPKPRPRPGNLLDCLEAPGWVARPCVSSLLALRIAKNRLRKSRRHEERNAWLVLSHLRPRAPVCRRRRVRNSGTAAWAFVPNRASTEGAPNFTFSRTASRRLGSFSPSTNTGTISTRLVAIVPKVSAAETRTSATRSFNKTSTRSAMFDLCDEAMRFKAQTAAKRTSAFESFSAFRRVASEPEIARSSLVQKNRKSSRAGGRAIRFGWKATPARSADATNRPMSPVAEAHGEETGRPLDRPPVLPS
jgi:hypothetical protein